MTSDCCKYAFAHADVVLDKAEAKIGALTAAGSTAG